MKHLYKLFIAASLWAGLAACGTDKSSTQLFAVFQSAFKGRAAAGETNKTITRADIAGFPDPLILASINTRGSALLGVSGTNGPDKTWRSADGVAFTLRKGVLVSTRGLGEDLMSANVPDIISMRGKTAHVYYYLDGSEVIHPVSHICTVTITGRESVVVLGKSYPTLRITETCHSGDLRIQNVFWIGVNRKIRKSKQFISDSVGYVTLQHVID